MKKLMMVMIGVLSVLLLSTTVFAENEEAGSTKLTADVPDATYTLNIPADQEIAFGATQTEIGELTVTDAAGFAKCKNLQVTINYSDFTCDSTETTIPIKLKMLYSSSASYADEKELESGGSVVFTGNSNGGVDIPSYYNARTYWLEKLKLNVNSSDWGKAQTGNYSTKIQFVTEVVVQE